MKPIEAPFTALSLLHDRITDKLNLVRSIGYQTAKSLALIQERHQHNQQRIYEIETRIDQLLIQSKQSNYQRTVAKRQKIDQKPIAGHERLSEVRQLRHQLRQRNELLRQSAHDLKGNFGIIQGATSLFSQAQTEEERQQMLEMLQRNLQQATQLVGELLDVTRLEAGQEQRQLSRFNVSELLVDLVETLQPIAHKGGLWLQQQGPDLLVIEGDAVKLRRIIQNLMLNAIKYTKEGGVTLDWSKESTNADWRLSVTDTGPGLSAKTKRIAEPGEGVGLLIVRQLCALLEGQLVVEEPQEGGTRFIMTFPQQYSA